MATRDTHKPATKATKTPSPVQRTPEQAVAEPETERTEQAVAGVANRLKGQQQARMMQRMQRTVGNAQVQRMLSSASNQPQIQRTAAAKNRTAPQQDPRFQGVTAKTKQVATKEKQHAPAKSKATEAQAAAQGPANDISSQAAASQVGKMSTQKPGTFNKAAFVAALNQAIAKITPKNQEEADEFKQSGKAGELKGQVTGLVKDNKESAEQNIETTTKEAPSPGNAKPKNVTPMKPEEAGPAPGAVGAGNAMPTNKTPQETSLAEGPQSIDQQMAKAEVTEEQIKKSNEPSFTTALTAKKQAETHATTAPQQFRTQEQAILGQARSEAGTMEQQAFSGMHTGRVGALGKVLGNKTTAKGQDERKRAEVATKIEGLYNKTKGDVTGILDTLDGKVNSAFDRGEARARAEFEQHVDARMKAYKEQRYGGLLGPAKWLKDKFLGMPSEVNAFFQEGRQLYLSRMQTVISSVADVVGAELNRAKVRIAQGRQEIQTYVNGLPKDLREVGQEAAENIQSRFDQLEQDVDSKQEALVQSLAQKYVSARDAVDSRITEMQKANQGLVAKAKDALTGVIQTIIELKNMLMGVLSRAAGVIGTIIKDPVRFLGNLIGAVKQGLNQFVGNIGKHLQQGLMGWLMGTLGGAGIRMPESLDLKGILSLVMQVMGLTYTNIRARAVKLVGERTVGAMEKTAQVFQLLASEGPVGMWHLIQDKVGDLKEQVLGQIKDFVITKIITAGITWLLSLFNPAAAFIKACKMIVDVIMFFIERGSQIMELVNAILDSVSAIASGSLGQAAAKVEQALGKALPVAISFLASLIGVGGISDRVKKIIGSVQKPIFSAIDGVVTAAAKGFKKLTGGKDKPGTEGEADSQARLKQGMKEGVTAVNALKGKSVSPAMLSPVLSKIRDRLKLRVLEPVIQDGYWAVHGEIQRETDKTELKAEEDLPKAKQAFGMDTFSTGQLASLLNVDVRTAQRRTKTWKDSGELFMLPENGLYTFDKSKVRDTSPKPGEHASIYVDKATGEILPAYPKIRDKFYKKNYRVDYADMVYKRADSGQRNANGEILYHCQNDGSKGPNHKPLVTENESEIDHIIDVTQHWNEQGHNMTQEQRNEWYDNPAHLRVLCLSCNSHKAKGLYIRKVGPNFRGPNDNP